MNFAALQRAIDDGTISLAACKRMGSTHAAYGWARTPYGHWTEDRKQAYFAGFDEERAKMKGVKL